MVVTVVLAAGGTLRSASAQQRTRKGAKSGVQVWILLPPALAELVVRA